VQVCMTTADQNLALRVQYHAHGHAQRGGRSRRAQLRYSALMRT
jgi:hypothetical protein